MSGITLFYAAESVRENLEYVDPETGEICEKYAQSRDLFEKKGVGCIAYIRESTVEIDAAKLMIGLMLDKLRAREKRLERFQGYVKDCMKASGIHEIRHEFGLFSATLALRRDESVQIDDGAVFPAELCNEPKPPTPSRSLIKAAILAGHPVAGARIVRADRLTIK